MRRCRIPGSRTRQRAEMSEEDLEESEDLEDAEDEEEVEEDGEAPAQIE